MKNIDLVNSKISKKLNIDEKIVKAVNKFYWSKGIRKSLSNLDDTAVFVRGLGTFTASRYNVRKKISQVISQIRGVRISKKFKENTREIYLETLFNKLRLLLNIRNELAKQYLNERTNRIPKTNPDSIEECGQSDRGDNE
jgi:ribosomal protein L31E